MAHVDPAGVGGVGAVVDLPPRRRLSGAWGLCEDCAGLEAATHTPTTHRRLVARLGVRARRGDIDPETYASALRAHRGHD